MADCFAVEKEDIFPPDYVEKKKKDPYADIDLGDLDIDFAKKKKKKAKKALENVENEIAQTETTLARTDAIATIMHAQAISAEAQAIAVQAKAVAMVADAVAGKLDEVVLALDEDLELLYSKKKKKKKALKAILDTEETAVTTTVTTDVIADVDDDTPTYDQMLERLYDQLYADRPHMKEAMASKRIKPPSLAKIGTKKTCWTNFNDYKVTFNRPLDHMQSFVLAELGTTGSLNDENQLIMKTRIMTKNVESLLRKYIDEYVRCVTCKGIDTNLVRDSSSKLHFIQCKTCMASRSVAAIKAGYQATTKADRKAARDA